MKDTIQLLNNLSSEDASQRNSAFLNLSLVVEKALIPALARENEQLLSVHHLLNLTLSESEAHIVLGQMAGELSGENTPLDIRACIAAFLGKFNKIEYFERVLYFLNANKNGLTNDLLYSVLTSINPQYFDATLFDSIRALLDTVGIVSILTLLKAREDQHLNESLFHLVRQLTAIGYQSESVKNLQNELLLWFIYTQRNDLCEDDVCGLIVSFDYELFKRLAIEDSVALLQKFKTVETLDLFLDRTHKEYLANLANGCPEELRDLVSEMEPEQQDALKDCKARIREFRDLLIGIRDLNR